MSLMSFLLASHALMVEHGFHVETQEQQAPSAADMGSRNAEAMSMLAGALAGTSGAPKVMVPR